MKQIPQLTLKMKLTPVRLKTAGWMAVASSFMTLPWFLFTYPLAGRTDLPIIAARAAMLVGRLALLVYLLVVFQQLLNRRYSFTAANQTISLMIQASIIHAAASLLGLAVPELSHAVALFSIVMMVILGIIYMMFGIWLLQLPASLGGMHRPFCYLNMVTGFSLATVLLLPLGMLTSTIADLMLGTIFLHQTKRSTIVA